MLCAERVPIVSPHSKCDDPNGFSRSPERPYLHYVVMPSPIGGADRSAPTYAASNSVGSRYLSPRDRPRHPRDLVGQGNGSHLGRPARHQPPQPRVFLRAVLLRIADDGHGTGDEKPPQVSIALLRNAAELVLAAGRVLLRHQPDPGGQTSS